MIENDFILFIFIPLFILVLVWLVYVFFTKRGRGRLYGGEILKEFEGVSSKRKIVSNSVKVYAVRAANNSRRVGIDIRTSTFGSYQMIPVSFTASEAKQLAEMLIEAAQHSANPPSQ